MTTARRDDRVGILGLDVHVRDRGTLLAELRRFAGGPHDVSRVMFYTNAHVFNLAADDESFRGLLNEADLLLCEGYGGRLAARIAGVRPLPEQLATMDWIDAFLGRMAADGHGIFLLGDEPGVAEACAAAMASRHPDLRVVGTHHGFFGESEATQLVARVAAAAPDVLMVGMGSPRQERWIAQNADRLDTPLILALGAMFRWYAVVERRAPKWMQRLHLEWLLRLVKHPIRHFRRYVIGNPRLVWRALRQRADVGQGGARLG